MARFGASKPADPAPASGTEARVRDLTERRDALDRRRSAILAEGDELRKALDRAAERGEDAATIAADLVAVDARAQAVALEAQAVGRVLAAAAAELEAEREAARVAALEARHLECEERFLDAEKRFRAALRAFASTIAPALAASRAFDDAARAVGKFPPPFRPEDADEVLVAELRGGPGVEYLRLEVPWTPAA